MDTAKSLQKSRNQFASRRKKSRTLNPGSCLGYKSIFIHLLAKETQLCVLQYNFFLSTQLLGKKAINVLREKIDDNILFLTAGTRYKEWGKGKRL